MGRIHGIGGGEAREGIANSLAPKVDGVQQELAFRGHRRVPSDGAAWRHSKAFEGERGGMDEDGSLKRTYKSEYRKKFRPFSQYQYIDGKFQKSRNDEVDGSKAWYKEVLELRRQAGQYRAKHDSGNVWETVQCRGWGVETASERMTEIYSKQLELWEQVSKRSSLQALSLANSAAPSRPISKAEKELENSRRSSPLKHSARDRNITSSSKPPKPVPLHKTDKTDSKTSKETTPRHHFDKISGSAGHFITSPTRVKLDPAYPNGVPGGRTPRKSPSAKSPTKDFTVKKNSPRTVTVAKVSPTKEKKSSLGRSVSVGPENRSPKRVSRPPSTHAPPPTTKNERRPRPTSLSAGSRRKDNAAAQQEKKPIKKPFDLSGSPKRSDFKAKEDKKRSSLDDAKKTTKDAPLKDATDAVKDAFAARKATPEPRFYPDKYEPVVKTPPEPTRVKSPDQVLVRSPDPVNWTVPLDTGKTFTVTHNIPEGEASRSTSSSEHRSRQTPEPTKIYQGSIAGTPITTAGTIIPSEPVAVTSSAASIPPVAKTVDKSKPEPITTAAESSKATKDAEILVSKAATDVKAESSHSVTFNEDVGTGPKNISTEKSIVAEKKPSGVNTSVAASAPVSGTKSEDVKGSEKVASSAKTIGEPLISQSSYNNFPSSGFSTGISVVGSDIDHFSFGSDVNVSTSNFDHSPEISLHDECDTSLVNVVNSGTTVGIDLTSPNSCANNSFNYDPTNEEFSKTGFGVQNNELEFSNLQSEISANLSVSDDSIAEEEDGNELLLQTNDQDLSLQTATLADPAIGYSNENFYQNERELKETSEEDGITDAKDGNSENENSDEAPLPYVPEITYDIDQRVIRDVTNAEPDSDISDTESIELSINSNQSVIVHENVNSEREMSPFSSNYKYETHPDEIKSELVDNHFGGNDPDQDYVTTESHTQNVTDDEFHLEQENVSSDSSDDNDSEPEYIQETNSDNNAEFVAVVPATPYEFVTGPSVMEFNDEALPAKYVDEDNASTSESISTDEEIVETNKFEDNISEELVQGGNLEDQFNITGDPNDYDGNLIAESEVSSINSEISTIHGREEDEAVVAKAYLSDTDIDTADVPTNAHIDVIRESDDVNNEDLQSVDSERSDQSQEQNQVAMNEFHQYERNDSTNSSEENGRQRMSSSSSVELEVRPKDIEDSAKIIEKSEVESAEAAAVSISNESQYDYNEYNPASSPIGTELEADQNENIVHNNYSIEQTSKGSSDEGSDDNNSLCDAPINPEVTISSISEQSHPVDVVNPNVHDHFDYSNHITAHVGSELQSLNDNSSESSGDTHSLIYKEQATTGLHTSDSWTGIDDRNTELTAQEYLEHQVDHQDVQPAIYNTGTKRSDDHNEQDYLGNRQYDSDDENSLRILSEADYNSSATSQTPGNDAKFVAIYSSNENVDQCEFARFSKDDANIYSDNYDAGYTNNTAKETDFIDYTNTLSTLDKQMEDAELRTTTETQENFNQMEDAEKTTNETPENYDFNQMEDAELRTTKETQETYDFNQMEDAELRTTTDTQENYNFKQISLPENDVSLETSTNRTENYFLNTNKNEIGTFNLGLEELADYVGSEVANFKNIYNDVEQSDEVLELSNANTDHLKVSLISEDNDEEKLNYTSFNISTDGKQHDSNIEYDNLSNNSNFDADYEPTATTTPSFLSSDEANVHSYESEVLKDKNVFISEISPMTENYFDKNSENIEEHPIGNEATKSVHFEIDTDYANAEDNLQATFTLNQDNGYTNSLQEGSSSINFDMDTNKLLEHRSDDSANDIEETNGNDYENDYDEFGTQHNYFEKGNVSPGSQHNSNEKSEFLYDHENSYSIQDHPEPNEDILDLGKVSINSTHEECIGSVTYNSANINPTEYGETEPTDNIYGKYGDYETGVSTIIETNDNNSGDEQKYPIMVEDSYKYVANLKSEDSGSTNGNSELDDETTDILNDEDIYMSEIPQNGDYLDNIISQQHIQSSNYQPFLEEHLSQEGKSNESGKACTISFDQFEINSNGTNGQHQQIDDDECNSGNNVATNYQTEKQTGDFAMLESNLLGDNFDSNSFGTENGTKDSQDPMTMSIFGSLNGVSEKSKPANQAKEVHTNPATTDSKPISSVLGGGNIRRLDDPFLDQNSPIATPPTTTKAAPVDPMSSSTYKVLEAPSSVQESKETKSSMQSGPSAPYRVLEAPVTVPPKAKPAPYRVLEDPLVDYSKPKSEPVKDTKPPPQMAAPSGKTMTEALDNAHSRFDSHWSAGDKKATGNV